MMDGKHPMTTPAATADGQYVLHLGVDAESCRPPARRVVPVGALQQARAGGRGTTSPQAPAAEPYLFRLDAGAARRWSREDPDVYAAVLALRKAGSTVYRNGRLHRVNGKILITIQLLWLGSPLIGRGKAAP